jgi:tetratricopeptide (TPR) repeat protein
MTDWTSAAAIVAAGVIAGIILIFFFKRKAAASQGDDLELRDLEAKRDALIGQIRDPDAAGGDERTRLELATAQILRQIDEHKRSSVKPAAKPVSSVNAPQRATLVGFAWGVASILVLGGLAYFVMQSAKPRQASQGVTGGVETSSIRAAQAPADPALQQLEAAVQKSPDDLNLRNELAHAYLEHENLMGVFEQTQYVLSKSPRDARALTYQAFVRMAMGQAGDAENMLVAATKSDPMLLDAWVGLAWAETLAGKAKQAEGAIAEAGRRHPEEQQRLQQVYAQMKQQASERQQQGRSALPEGHPAVPDAPEAAAATGAAIHITLDAAPAAKAKGGTVFVIARAEGVSAGPPVAVKRLDVAMLPITIDLTSADSMTGQPLPPKMRLEARVDSDGNALTRDPGDASAVQDGVAVGSSVKMKMQ